MLLASNSIFKRSTLALLTGLCFLAAFEEPAYADGGYLTIEAGPRVFDHEDVKASLDSVDSPAGDADGSIDGYGVDVTFGGTSLQSIPALAGSSSVLEVQLHYASADESDTEISTTGLLGFMPIDGSSISDGAAGTFLDFETDFEQYGVDLLVRSKVSETSATRTSAVWGITWSRFEQEHEFSGRDAMGAFITDRFLEDDIDTDYFGVVLGLGVEHKLGNGWALSADGRLDLLVADAELDADQRLTIFGNLSVSDDETELAGRFAGKVGVARNVGGITFGANATVDYLTYAPTVEHPLFDSNPFPSQLDDDSLFTYGLNLYLKASF